MHFEIFMETDPFGVLPYEKDGEPNRKYSNNSNIKFLTLFV